MLRWHHGRVQDLVADPSEVERTSSRLGRVARSTTFITAGSSLFVYGLSLLTGPILGRSLGPSGRGDLAAVMVPAQLLGFALLLGLPYSSIYWARKHPHRQLVSVSWMTSVVLVAIIGAASFWWVPPLLANHSPTTVPWLQVFVFMCLVYVPCTTALELFRTRSGLVAFNVFRSMPLVLNAVFLITLFLLGKVTLVTALASQLTAQVLSYIGIAFASRGTIIPTRVPRPVIVDQLSYASRVWLGEIASLAISRIDQLLLIGMVATADLGHYAVSATAAQATTPAATAIIFTVFPKIRHAHSSEEGWAATVRAARIAGVVAFGIASVTAILAPFVIPWLWGADFRESIAPLLVLLPGQVFADVGMVLTTHLQAIGRPATGSRALAVSAVVAVVGILVLVPRIGILGAALSTTVSQLCLFLYVVIAGWRTRREPVLDSSAEEPMVPHDDPLSGGA